MSILLMKMIVTFFEQHQRFVHCSWLKWKVWMTTTTKLNEIALNSQNDYYYRTIRWHLVHVIAMTKLIKKHENHSTREYKSRWSKWVVDQLFQTTNMDKCGSSEIISNQIRNFTCNLHCIDNESRFVGSTKSIWMYNSILAWYSITNWI